MKTLTLLAIALFVTSTAFAAGSDSVLGLWKTDGGESQVELFKCGDGICGKVVWLKVPKYIDSADGPVGKIKVDRKNPDSALRNRPIIGLRVMNGFVPKGGKRWSNGTCYNPVTGKSYKSKMYLASADKLELRGYIGISFIGRTSVLTR